MEKPGKMGYHSAMKAAVIAIAGRPSAGKSTLLNRLCGQKVSIVSSEPQTTRNTIRGILTDERGQLVLIDTPGFHLSEKKINLRMKSLVAQSLADVDVTLYVVDSSRPPGEEERALAAVLARQKTPVVVALNKIDLSAAARPRKPEGDRPPGESPSATAHSVLLSESLPSAPVCPISAIDGGGVDALIDRLFEIAPEGELMYPAEFYTDQPPEFRISEIIREKAIERVRQEVPHALYVDIADIERNGETDDGSEQRLWIRAFLVIERESQKAILIGRKGAMIKEIRVAAQREIQKVFPYHVYLDLRVKVDPKWRKSDPILKRLIY